MELKPWQIRARQLKFELNKSWTETYSILKAEYPKDNLQDAAIRTFLRRQPEYGSKPSEPVDNPEEIIITLINRGAKLEQLSKAVKLSERVTYAMIDDLRDKGYGIELNRDGVYKLSKGLDATAFNVTENNWSGEKIIRFGLMGDTQINSKYAQLTYLHKLYDIYEAEGIETVYHTGDIDDGEEMRVGHKYECYNQGVDDHIDEIVRVYPRRKNMRTEFITGNHDHSIIKRVGLDIGNQIASRRDDMKYLGQSSAWVYLTPNCTLELRHPIDGTAYAISYKTQKMIEAMSGGEKPNILASGHYHKAEYIFYRNIHCFQTGTLQAQTPWMRGKQIAAMMGGWIVEVHVNDDGNITRIKPEWIPFYRAIRDDYKNWA